MTLVFISTLSAIKNSSIAQKRNYKISPHASNITFHTVASFREISRIVADEWKKMEATTNHYVEAVSTLLKQRHSEITQQTMSNGMKKGGQEPQESRWSPSPAKYHMVQQYPRPPVIARRPNMMKLLPENYSANLPYCGECDSSVLAHCQGPGANLPTPTKATQTTTSYVSHVNSHEKDVLQKYLDIAATVSSQYAHLLEYSATNGTVLCGECTH